MKFETQYQKKGKMQSVRLTDKEYFIIEAYMKTHSISFNKAIVDLAIQGLNNIKNEATLQKLFLAQLNESLVDLLKKETEDIMKNELNKIKHQLLNSITLNGEYTFALQNLELRRMANAGLAQLFYHTDDKIKEDKDREENINILRKEGEVHFKQ